VRRLAIPLVFAIALIVGLVIFDTGDASPAATVNGTAISQSKVDDELSAIADSSQYRCYLNADTLVRTGGQSVLPAMGGTTPQTMSPKFSAVWLNHDITAILIAQRRASLGIPAPDATKLAVARMDLLASMDATLGQVASGRFACTGSAPAVLATMPTWFINDQVQTQAESEAIVSHIGGIGLERASLQRYFDQNPTKFDTVCLSGILVGDKATADSVRARLIAGADFAGTAGAMSQDASKTKGGSLGCFDPTSPQYIQAQQNVGSLSPGSITQPHQSGQSSWVILKVDSRTPTVFAANEDFVRRTVIGVDAVASQRAVAALIRHASVSVNPRFGTWTRTASGIGVAPPGTPSASSAPITGANRSGG